MRIRKLLCCVLAAALAGSGAAVATGITGSTSLAEDAGKGRS